MSAPNRGGQKPHPSLAPAIEAYLSGEGSYAEVASRYGLVPKSLAAGVKRHRQKLRGEPAGTPAAYSRAYEKTERGFLMRVYRNMKSRVTGIQKNKAHLYLGKALLAKEDFYAWALESREFRRLYGIWVASGYDRRLAPSIDRINPREGYTLDNMRWLTLSQNSSLANRGRLGAEKKVIYNIVGVQHA